MQVCGIFKLAWVKLINNAFSFPLSIVCLEASLPSEKKILMIKGGPTEDYPQEWVWLLAVARTEAISTTFKENGPQITLQGEQTWQSEKLSLLRCFNPPAPHLQNAPFIASIWYLERMNTSEQMRAQRVSLQAHEQREV